MASGGGRRGGKPSVSPPASLLTNPGPVKPSYLPGMGCAVLAAPGPPLRRAVAGDRERAHSALGNRSGARPCPGPSALPPTWAFSIRRPVPWPLVPSELCPLPALRILPTLPSLPTLFLSPAVRGRRQGSEPQLVLLTADWQLAKARRPHQCLVPPSGRMYLGCLG